jgi:BlaI family transcriptional regulator, penicillinase repressor
MGSFTTSAMVLPSAAELRLLEILWRLGEGTIEDVLQASCEYPPRNYKTVQTILRLMETKKLVSHRSSGRAFVYHPRVMRDQVNRLTIQRLVKRQFGGSRTELLLNMLEDQELELAELEELETLIRRYRKSKQSPDRRADRKQVRP